MMIENETDDAGEHLRYVYIQRPRCPACGSENLHRTRTEDQGDGSICKTMNCLDCQHHFFVIEE